MIQIHILGISGSPRLKGNTSTLVQKCLEGAKMRGATTEFLSLADCIVNPCRGCEKICHPTFYTEIDHKAVINNAPWNLCSQNDDGKEIIEKMSKADSIIIGSPVYFANISAQTKALFDRCTSIGQFTHEGKLLSAFKNKVGGSVVVGGCRHGGQSFALHTIVTFFSFLGMIPVGFGEREDQALGLSGVAYSADEIFEDKWKNFIGRPESAIEHAIEYGRKITDISAVIAAGLSSGNIPSYGDGL